MVLTKASDTALTLVNVSIRLAPMRFLTSMAMAGLPLRRVIVVASAKVERIVAMSLACTTALGPATTGSAATSSGVSISDGTLTAYLPCEPSILPAATRLLEAPTAPISWSSCSPYEDSFIGSMTTSTRSSREPCSEPSRTPGTSSMRSRSSRAAAASTRSGNSPDSVTTSTGNSEMLTSVTTGSSAACGRSALPSCTLERVSCSAVARLVCGWNSTST
ncbi:hypothetical protein ACVINZ_003422 [Mesorhizobium jarvisii]